MSRDPWRAESSPDQPSPEILPSIPFATFVVQFHGQVLSVPSTL